MKSGITLVALIITIIILLILAVVTISAVNEGNLFAHANNAAIKYSAEAELENTKISEWLTRLGEIEEIGGTPKNFLQKEGLTSPNVIFNTTYTCDNYTRAEGIEATIEVTDNSIILKENGTIRVKYDEELLNTFYTMAAQNASEHPEYTEEEWYIIIRSMYCPLSSDYIEYAEGGGSYYWLLKFTNPGTIKVYYATYEDSIESVDDLYDDNYFVGTFTAS